MVIARIQNETMGGGRNAHIYTHKGQSNSETEDKFHQPNIQINWGILQKERIFEKITAKNSLHLIEMNFSLHNIRIHIV